MSRVARQLHLMGGVGAAKPSEGVTVPGAMDSDLADEFYNERAHPTVANFRSLSLTLLHRWFEDCASSGPVVEVGAGRSVFVDIGASRSRNKLCLDLSPRMLEHSTIGRQANLWCAIANANALPVRSRTVALVIASLGAPFNWRAFWLEASRVLTSNGEIWYSTPSYEWASSVRPDQAGHGESETATFQVKGETQDVPSITYPESQQISLIRSAGLEIVEIARAPVASLPVTNRAPSIILLGETTPVVTAFRCKISTA